MIRESYLGRLETYVVHANAPTGIQVGRIGAAVPELRVQHLGYPRSDVVRWLRTVADELEGAGTQPPESSE